MNISIIITCSRPALAIECLKGFALQSNSLLYEIIVVGNVTDLSQTLHNVRVLEVKDQHPNAKRNRGIAIAQSEIIALMDDDAIPCKDWVKEALESSLRYPGMVLTGPEDAYPNSNNFATLTHQLFSSPFAEFSRAHLNTKLEKVNWYDVPFCNCVFPRTMWKDAGGLDETIPWHMDDFHFFFPFRNNVSFYNIPAMYVYHNRYPESLKKLIKYKWRLRKETGEKLIKYPYMYWSIPGVAGAILISIVLFVAMVFFLVNKPMVVVVVAILYFALLLVATAKQTGFSDLNNVVVGISVLATVHIISITGLYYGWIITAAKRFLR